MYNSKIRDEIFNDLVDNFKSREEILSIIQIGSGAVGYKDQYSDIDLAIVTEDIDISKIFTDTSKHINSKYKCIIEDNIEDRKLELFLLDNYLEIDIGYYTLKELYARRGNYKVIFDKTGKAQNIMDESWNKLKELNKGTTNIVNMNDVISNIDKNLWYNVMHSIVAYKRDNIFRCYYELQLIKDYAIDLIAKRNNFESKRYRDLVKLNEEEQNFIASLFQMPKTEKELNEYLVSSLKTIFSELDYWKEKDDIDYKVSYEFLIGFVKENISNL